jgi:hypothetical protein
VPLMLWVCVKQDYRCLYSLTSLREGRPESVFDQESSQRFSCETVCPPWLLAIWSRTDRSPWLLHDDLRDAEKQQQHINALELLALVVVVWTCGEEIFRDRQVLFFIDNTAALSVAVRGCAKSPHLAALSKTLHLSLVCLKRAICERVTDLNRLLNRHPRVNPLLVPPRGHPYSPHQFRARPHVRANDALSAAVAAAANTNGLPD